MPYFEIGKSPFGLDFSLRGPLDEDQILEGKVKGQDIKVKIENPEMVSHFVGGQRHVKFQEEGAVVFDKPKWFRGRKGLVYLNSYDAGKLETYRNISKNSQSSGFYWDMLVGVFRRAEEQAGLRLKGKRTAWEYIEAILSAGATEEFSP